jgi:hypothetical protein
MQRVICAPATAHLWPGRITRSSYVLALAKNWRAECDAKIAQVLKSRAPGAPNKPLKATIDV